jgi:hypothetical protein
MVRRFFAYAQDDNEETLTNLQEHLWRNQENHPKKKFVFLVLHLKKRKPAIKI